MKKIFLLLILVAAGALLAAFVWRRTHAAAEPAEAAEAKLITVQRDTIDLTVSTTGRIVSNLDVEIKSKASGQIIMLPYDISDRVSSGALLAELDPVDENRNVAQREAALMSARARLAQAEENLAMALTDLETGTSNALAQVEAAKVQMINARNRLQRQEELYKKNLVSREELDAARAEAAAAERALTTAEVSLIEVRNLPRTVELRRHDITLQKAQVQQAEVELANAQQRLRETKIYAPMDGVITSRPVQTGMIIASGISNVGGGTTLMTLSDLSRIFVNANVDEADIGKVRVGQRAIITADAYPGRKFRGRVERIATKGTNKSDVVTFEVKIEVEGEGRELLKPEMTANLDIQADRRENVIVLPNEAILSRPDGYFVEVMDDSTTDSARRVRIQTGITDGLKTEIVSGLEENQKVRIPDSMQSRWARGAESGGRGGSDMGRAMRRATFSLRGGGRR